MNNSSNAIWKAQQNYSGFENRAFRFTDDMRPLFFKWLGISSDSYVLDAGCGTGVFTRYLAAGLDKGHIDGFDINEGFIEYGIRKLQELQLTEKVSLKVDDGFALSCDDNAYDAVTNYTYIGVLSDPVAGLREMIRVCRPGGVVSCVVATNAIPPVGWQGDYPFEGADELQVLSNMEAAIFAKHVRKISNLRQSQQWHALRYPKLFEFCGLRHIAIHPFGYTFNYNDETYPLSYRQELLLKEIHDDMNWITSRYNSGKEIYEANGFSGQQFERLMELMERKQEYVTNHFAEDRSFEWTGGFNFIVTGIKD